MSEKSLVSETEMSETKTGTGSQPGDHAIDDRSISAWTAQIWGVLLMVPTVFVCVAPYLLIWGDDALDGTLDGVHGGVLIGLFVGGIVVHEPLHGIGWAWAGRQGWGAISFGFKLKSLTPHAHVEGPLEARAYRFGTALPGLALGLLPWAASLLVGHGPLHMFGVVFTAVAVGDALVLWLVRDIPGDTQVKDHPDRVGFLLAGKDKTGEERISPKEELPEEEPPEEKPPEGASPEGVPPEGLSPTGPTDTCQNCGMPEEGAYCSRCGQKQVTGRFTLRSILTSALAELANLDRGSFATAYRLTTEPGKLIRDYWARRTQPFVNPVRYFLFAVAAYQVALWQTGAAQNMVRGFLKGGDGDPKAVTSTSEALQFFGDYFVLFFVVGVLVLALVSRIGSPRNVAEELILQLYTWGHVALLLAVSMGVGHVIPIPASLRYMFGVAVLVGTVAYYVWADAAAHRPDTDRSTWRDAVEALGTLFLFVFAYTALIGFLAGLLAEALS